MKVKRILIYLSCLLSFGSLVYLNAQYPFRTSKVGKWSVGYGFSENPMKEPIVSSKNIISYKTLDSLLKNEGNYIADPFFIRERNIFYLFVELKGKDNGDIALFISKNGTDYDYEGIVLDEAFHVSYPQVFKYRNEFYMLPETKQSGNVLLYKAKEFPYHWEIEDTLIKNVFLKDPSILLNENENLIVTVDDNMNQVMYESDSLKGDWKLSEKFQGKKGNETRPGGRFFKYKKDWYLPVQDRTYGYGSGISLYKLEKTNDKIDLILWKKRYLKGQDDILWFNRGMHHLDFQQIGNSYYMVYDGDRNLGGEKVFQIKRTLKFNYYDLFN
ncbi:hypothetical protein [Christiangramia aquimixticola]|uniref:glucosamine inositolphosphorylceramide transferase family protein n=1 Tax=Christiangramia aquimixticola TaxID=1697558 RepID=UPI003AA9445C